MNLFPCLKLRKLYQMTRRRFASGGDSIRLMVADREVVGHGINGRPIYFDSPDCPFPAIRYQEVNSKLCALREKELDDWKNLSLDEKKQLYRHSFCQTYAEFQHFTPEWKICLAVALWLVSVGIAISISMKTMLYGKLPQTFDDERQSAQLRRIIQLQMNPITGLSSKWCYQENKWK
ncbi:uncharacterized protein Dyak_GE15061 [Drosophila yakuba]|uniref:Cytochrome c oxidase subunit 4 n=2 Tax=Drosophila yakuba TaxID=7245 RepID=B4IVZ6_DROYA|nr:uncharacterized protein Dyak_GE15061 [Drosophila yakuba]